MFGFRTTSTNRRRSHAHRYVDMWAFMGVHPCNMEFFQRLKMADDRNFGANMDVCGTVSERNPQTNRWEQSHVVGIRTDAWNPNRGSQSVRLQQLQIERQETLRRRIRASGALNAKETTQLQRLIAADPVMKMRPGDLETRRLVMKLFCSGSQRMRWAGTLEEVVTREIHNSLGGRRTLLSFSGTLGDGKHLIELQENHRTFRVPSIYTGCYLEEKRGRLWYMVIRRKWISVGADFVVETEGRKIADIDGALFGFGYNAHVYVYEPELAGDSRFVDLLTLFATTVGYHAAMRRSLRRRLHSVQRGLAGQQIIEDEELKLLKNPRAA